MDIAGLGSPRVALDQNFDWIEEMRNKRASISQYFSSLRPGEVADKAVVLAAVVADPTCYREIASMECFALDFELALASIPGRRYDNLRVMHPHLLRDVLLHLNDNDEVFGLGHILRFSLVDENGRLFNDDELLVLAFLKKKQDQFIQVSPRLQKDPAFVKKAFQANSGILIPDHILKDPEIYFLALAMGNRYIHRMPKNINEDPAAYRKACWMAVEKEPWFILEFCKEMKHKDPDLLKEIVRRAVQIDPQLKSMLPRDIDLGEESKEGPGEAFHRGWEERLRHCRKDFIAYLEAAGPNYDREIVKRYITRRPLKWFPKMPEALRNEEEFARIAVNANRLLFTFVGPQIVKKLVYEFIDNEGFHLHLFHLGNAVDEKGKPLNNDFDIVMRFLKNGRGRINDASLDLRKVPELVGFAVNEYWGNIEFAFEPWNYHRDLVLKLLSEMPSRISDKRIEAIFAQAPDLEQEAYLSFVTDENRLPDHLRGDDEFMKKFRDKNSYYNQCYNAISCFFSSIWSFVCGCFNY